jgi:hypothetical protein
MIIEKKKTLTKTFYQTQSHVNLKQYSDCCIQTHFGWIIGNSLALTSNMQFLKAKHPMQVTNPATSQSLNLDLSQATRLRINV